MPDEVNGIYVFVSVEPGRDQEMIIGMRDNRHWQPLITSDVEEVERLKPIAKRHAQNTKRAVKLIRFADREELPL